MKILIAKAYHRISFDGLLARGLNDRGHEVHLLYPQEPYGPDTAELRNIGIPIHINPIIQSRFLRKDTPANLTKNFHRLRQLLKNQRYDIINLHLPAARLFGRWAALVLGHQRVVSVIHGYECHHERWTNWIDQRTVCVSAAVRSFLMEQGVLPHKLHVIPNGLDLAAIDNQPIDHFYLHRELKLDQKVPLIGMIAYFYKPTGRLNKGHRFFIDAARLLAPLFPRVHFIIVGSDCLSSGEEEYCRRYARHCGLGNRISFLGERQDIIPIMDSLTVHVVPSLSEGFGLVIAEAMARGIVNVASDLASLREIIHPDKTGILFEPGNAEHLAKSITGVLADPQRAGQIGHAGRKRIESSFTIERMAAGYEKLFEQILHRAT